MLSRQGALDGFGLPFDDPKKRASSAIRAPTALFPILQSIQLEAETRGELSLRKPEPLPNCGDINLDGYMRDGAITRSTGIVQRFSGTSQNTLTAFRHLGRSLAVRFGEAGQHLPQFVLLGFGQVRSFTLAK
jgi:hypothetical protein